MTPPVTAVDQADSTPVVSMDGLKFRYDGAAEDVLQIDRLHIGSGEFVSLLGASGSGKSTILRLVAALLTPTAGSVRCSLEASERAMVFQSPTLVPWRSAEANIRLPAELGASPAASGADVLELAHLVGLDQSDLHKRPAELSGGMQMRAAIARALILQPRLLLLDEPFAALDDVLRMRLESDVRRIHRKRSLTSILVTHNIAEAVFMSDRILVLGDHRILHDVSIDLPASRDSEIRSSAAFHATIDRVTKLLHESVH